MDTHLPCKWVRKPSCLVSQETGTVGSWLQHSPRDSSVNEPLNEKGSNLLLTG